MLNRRKLLLLAASLPAPAIAQTTPVDPAPAAPSPPPTTLSPPAAPTPPPVTPRPSPAPIAAPATSSPAIDAAKTYYIFYDQTIDVASMRALRRQLNTLVEAGVSDITLVIHSPGGLIDPTLAIYSFIRALPARVNTHAIGFVMSAACLLFLAGENRSADRNARFLFHPAQAPITGSMTGQQVEDRLTQFDAANAAMAQVYHDRTKLTDADIDHFTHGQVFYTPEEAKDRGIIQTIADLRIPNDQKARMLFLD